MSGEWLVVANDRTNIGRLRLVRACSTANDAGALIAVGRLSAVLVGSGGASVTKAGAAAGFTTLSAVDSGVLTSSGVSSGVAPLDSALADGDERSVLAGRTETRTGLTGLGLMSLPKGLTITMSAP
jgi:hypothetical protein